MQDFAPAASEADESERAPPLASDIDQVADERKEDVAEEQTKEDGDDVKISARQEDDMNNSSSIANTGLDQQEAEIVPESPQTQEDDIMESKKDR